MSTVGLERTACYDTICWDSGSAPRFFSWCTLLPSLQGVNSSPASPHFLREAPRPLDARVLHTRLLTPTSAQSRHSYHFHWSAGRNGLQLSDSLPSRQGPHLALLPILFQYLAQCLTYNTSLLLVPGFDTVIYNKKYVLGLYPHFWKLTFREGR